MSHSKRAKERRQWRKRLSKHERVIMGKQHFGDRHPRTELRRGRTGISKMFPW